jgi:hypothetical protein
MSSPPAPASISNAPSKSGVVLETACCPAFTPAGIGPAGAWTCTPATAALVAAALEADTPFTPAELADDAPLLPAELLDSEFDAEFDSEFDSEFDAEFDSEFDAEFDSEFDAVSDAEDEVTPLHS